MAVDERRIAVLGAGRIGEALISGLLSSGWREPGRDRRVEPARRAGRRARGAVRHPGDDRQRRGGRAARRSSSSSVKPQDIEALLGEIGPAITAEQTVLSVAAATPTATIERHLADGRARRPGDAEHAVDRPRGDRRALRRRPRRRRARDARRGGARPPRLGRPRPGALDGRGHRRLGLRARLLRAPRRGDDRGRPPARALARDLDPARRPDDARHREAAPRRGHASRRAARDGHLARAARRSRRSASSSPPASGPRSSTRSRRR